MPIPRGIDLISEHRSLLASVPVEIALAVALDVEPAHHPRPVNGSFPDPGIDGASLPGDVLWLSVSGIRANTFPPTLTVSRSSPNG
jgi:hypothetical protein